MGKVNKSLKAWVAFVKSVQKKYKLNYKDAIHKAKELKDKGADWMNKGLKSVKGGGEDEAMTEGPEDDEIPDNIEGGRRRRTRRRRGNRSRALRRSVSRRRSASRRASRRMALTLGVA